MPAVDIGSFSSGLVTGLREGVEAALIVAIILAYVVRTGNGQQASKIWLGTGTAIALSALVGLLLFVTVGEMPAPYEQIFEGATLLAAAVVVTWMLFWMRRQARSVRGDLQAAVDRVLTSGGAWGLAALAFTAIIREGIETSLFLVGQATSPAASAGSVILGAVAGLAIAAVLGYGFYRGTRRINLARFFRWTGVALVFIAAGLLANAVHEFVEIGIVGIGTQPAFDISRVLPDNAGVGQFLHALLGYSAAPEVSRLIVHVGYLVVVLALFLRPAKPLPTPPSSNPRPEAART